MDPNRDPATVILGEPYQNELFTVPSWSQFIFFIDLFTKDKLELTALFELNWTLGSRYIISKSTTSNLALLPFLFELIYVKLKSSALTLILPGHTGLWSLGR